MYADDDFESVSSFDEWQAALEAEREAMTLPYDAWWATAARPDGSRSDPERSDRQGEAASGITAPSSSHDSWQVSGGVDYLEVTCWGIHEMNYPAIEKLLQSAWQSAASGGNNRRVEVEGATLVMREKGFRWGSTFFGYVGDADGITYALRRSDVRGEFVAKVQIGSLKLMRDGHRAAWAQAVRVLRALGVTITRTKVFRIDLCVDLPGVSVAPFVQAVMDGHCVRRSTDTQYTQASNGDWQAVGLGRRKGSVYLRIYDKLKELEAHPNEAEAKRHVLIERRWGVMPTIATRVEYQCSGDWMKERWAECTEVEDVFGKLSSMMHYLTSSFFRVCDGPVDRDNKHQSRAVTAPIWSEIVIESFRRWIDVEAVPLMKMEKKAVDRSRTGRRLVSAAISCAALTPGGARDLQSLLQLTANAICRWADEEDVWKGKLQSKIDAMDSSGRSSVFTFEEVDGPEFGGYRVTVDELPDYHLGIHRTFVPADVVPF